jgi:hypothetical protein
LRPPAGRLAQFAFPPKRSFNLEISGLKYLPANVILPGIDKGSAE